MSHVPASLPRLFQSSTTETPTPTKPVTLYHPDLASPPPSQEPYTEPNASYCKNAACSTAPGGVVAMSSVHSWSTASSQISSVHQEQHSVMTVTPLELALYWQQTNKKKNLCSEERIYFMSWKKMKLTVGNVRQHFQLNCAVRMDQCAPESSCCPARLLLC